ncbi:MAG TPA: hypothetical protein VN380_12620 [Thermoanaerobaculia bacterium]|jgi:hypothetical protein|nr:hypothetical protein [Thermoanaerobaculia bacterium]
MNAEQQAAVVDYMVGRLSYEDLVRRTGIDPVGQPGVAERELRAGLAARDAGTIECALLLAFRFELLTPDMASLLGLLLLEPWHQKHEDIAKILQELREPATADALAGAAVVKHDYLAYDDSHALARKCIWALADIGTPAAREHLERLSGNPDHEVAAYAQKRLDNWEQELPRKRPSAPGGEG